MTPRAVEQAVETEAKTICGARTSLTGCRHGAPCTENAGKGTDHQGMGRCYKHDAPLKVGDARLLKFIAADPDLVKCVDAYLEDPDLLTPKRELALLKAELALLDRDPEEGSHIPVMLKLIRAIGSLSEQIREMEIGKRHYLHISVVGQIVAAYGEIGRRFLPEGQRQEFANEVKNAIRHSIGQSSARAIAANVVTSSEPMVIDVEPVPLDVDEETGEPVIHDTVDEMFDEADNHKIPKEPAHYASYENST